MQHKKQDIDQVLLACKQGNRQAQLYIYKQYYRAMYNTAYRIVRDKQEAENVMQEAFLAAFTKLNMFQGQSTFGAWLKRIVVNKSINSLRGKKEYVEIDDKKHDAPIESPIDEAQIKSKVKQTVDAISSLKDKYRIPLALNVLEGYDCIEIAEILGLTHQNTKTIVSRAKIKIRAMVK